MSHATRVMLVAAHGRLSCERPRGHGGERSAEFRAQFFQRATVADGASLDTLSEHGLLVAPPG